MEGENQNQNHPYCYYPRISPHPPASMPQYTHHNIPPNPYPRVSPYPIFLCPYFTSTTIYAPYVVPHYPQIPSLGYIHRPPSIITSFILPVSYSKSMSEYSKKRRNIRSNEQKNKTRYVMSKS